MNTKQYEGPRWVIFIDNVDQILKDYRYQKISISKACELLNEQIGASEVISENKSLTEENQRLRKVLGELVEAIEETKKDPKSLWSDIYFQYQDSIEIAAANARKLLKP